MLDGAFCEMCICHTCDEWGKCKSCQRCMLDEMGVGNRECPREGEGYEEDRT